MLPVRPQIRSATPMALFRGQAHQAMLMSHLQSADATHYDSLLMVNPIGKEEFCLIVSLESAVAGQPLTLAMYIAKGRFIFPPKPEMRYGRENFLAYALLIVQQTLQDRLVLVPPPQTNRPIVEKTFAEFYPDAKRRLDLHYFFAHLWLPAYVQSDPARFFGYFQRREQNPTHFIQARWQLMEHDRGLVPDVALGESVIRRVADLQMWVEMPEWSASGASPATTLTTEFASNLPVAVVQMPAPEFMTHAYFVGIVLLAGMGADQTSVRSKARVFTLERREGQTADGVLCEWIGTGNNREHRNYNSLVPVQREEFVKAFLAKLTDLNGPHGLEGR